MQVHDFPQALVQKIHQDMQPHGRRNLHSRPPRAKDRISCLHWNPGGLSQAVFHEIRQWLLQHPVDVVVITETRWSISSNWADRNWLYVHTASPESRSGGILTMISRRIAEPEQLGYAAIADGRLLHLRLHYDKRALDILVIYQYVDQRSSMSMQQRDRIWTALNDTLHRIPSRNNLLCAGDFNCSLSAMPPWVGSTTFKWNGGNTKGVNIRIKAASVTSCGLTVSLPWTLGELQDPHTYMALLSLGLTISCLAFMPVMGTPNKCDFFPLQILFLPTALIISLSSAPFLHSTCHTSVMTSLHHAHMRKGINADKPDSRRHSHGIACANKSSRQCTSHTRQPHLMK